MYVPLKGKPAGHAPIDDAVARAKNKIFRQDDDEHSRHVCDVDADESLLTNGYLESTVID